MPSFYNLNVYILMQRTGEFPSLLLHVLMLRLFELKKSYKGRALLPVIAQERALLLELYLMPTMLPVPSQKLTHLLGMNTETHTERELFW